MATPELTTYLCIERNGQEIEVELRGWYEPGQRQTRDEPGFGSSVDGYEAFQYNTVNKKYDIPVTLSKEESKDADDQMENALISYEEDQADQANMDREDY